MNRGGRGKGRATVVLVMAVFVMDEFVMAVFVMVVSQCCV